MAFTVCDCEHISWKPCHSSQLHFLPGSRRPVPVSCQRRVHFGYSYATYSSGVFPFPLANARMLARLILSPAPRSQQGGRRGPSRRKADDRPRGAERRKGRLVLFLCLLIVVEIWELVARALSIERSSPGLLSGAVWDWVFYFLWCSRLRIGKWELNNRCIKPLFW